ncbi:hypothetical protein [Sphingomicrobium flavum]|uniref:hypothetical protein n=1 Tax=Sphingomicrobium flavum TaxID=1229164 RepID=UPI0021ADEEC2|nr:hypothetical protein [Sphingomicrobium flavum]
MNLIILLYFFGTAIPLILMSWVLKLVLGAIYKGAHLEKLIFGLLLAYLAWGFADLEATVSEAVAMVAGALLGMTTIAWVWFGDSFKRKKASS